MLYDICYYITYVIILLLLICIIYNYIFIIMLLRYKNAGVALSDRRGPQGRLAKGRLAKGRKTVWFKT